MNSFSRGLAAAIALGLSALAGPALAQVQQMAAERLAVTDLDLSTPTGKAELEHRVRKSAASLCRRDGANTGPSLEAQDGFDRCYRKAVQDALIGR